MDNPCPECQPIADDLAAEKKTMAGLQADKGQVDQAAIDNQVEQGDIGKRIATLNARIESQKGSFAEGYDPESGLTIRSENIGGGKVRITTRDGSGRITEERTRDSGSAKRMQERIKELEKQLKDLKQKEAELRKKSDDLGKKIDASQKKIDELAKALEKCVEEKCKKKLVACPKPPADSALIVGANSDVGSGAQLKARVKETIGGLFGSALGGFLGGRGGDGGGDAHDEPQTVRDPVPAEKQKSFTNPSTETTIKAGGMVDEKGLLVSCHIEDAPGDGTFQTVFVENADGQRAGPTDYLVYEMYSEWALIVSWTRDEWVDGQHVDHQEGGWDESGSIFLGTFAVPVENEGIWKKLGFNNAVKGIQGLGTRFPITKEQLQSGPVNVVVHITRPDEDPVITTPFIFLLSLTPEGELNIEQVDQTLAQSACDPTRPM